MDAIIRILASAACGEELVCSPLHPLLLPVPLQCMSPSFLPHKIPNPRLAPVMLFLFLHPLSHLGRQQGRLSPHFRYRKQGPRRDINLPELPQLRNGQNWRQLWSSDPSLKLSWELQGFFYPSSSPQSSGLQHTARLAAQLISQTLNCTSFLLHYNPPPTHTHTQTPTHVWGSPAGKAGLLG